MALSEQAIVARRRGVAEPPRSHRSDNGSGRGCGGREGAAAMREEASRRFEETLRRAAHHGESPRARAS